MIRFLALVFYTAFALLAGAVFHRPIIRLVDKLAAVPEPAVAPRAHTVPGHAP